MNEVAGEPKRFELVNALWAIGTKEELIHTGFVDDLKMANILFTPKMRVRVPGMSADEVIAEAARVDAEFSARVRAGVWR